MRILEWIARLFKEKCSSCGSRAWGVAAFDGINVTRAISCDQCPEAKKAFTDIGERMKEMDRLEKESK